MWIYAVYRNKIYRTEVKETKKMFVSKGFTGLPFDCRSSFYRGECSVTCEEAIEAAINNKLTTIKGLKDKLTNAETDLCKLKELPKEIDY